MSDPGETIRFTVSVPSELLEALDRRVGTQAYASRSELVRDLIRERMIADRWAAGDQEVVGVLTIAYDHHVPDLPQRIMEVQHSRFVNVLCTTHVHLDHDHCLEAVIIRGRPSEIERIAAQIGGLRGVTACGLTKAAIV
ncbi:MAG: nickel-responsive transcriptional regulator NikR [Candidatus Eisenbacteria bacterium]|nr:nickel-responsive transcriptional regulator NikR [Candidatus Eisenbacteria bacterium]